MTTADLKKLVDYLDKMAAALAAQTVETGFKFALTGKSLTPREEELARAFELSTKTTVFRTLYVLAKNFLPEDEREPGLSDEIFDVVYAAQDADKAEATAEAGKEESAAYDELETMMRRAENYGAPYTGPGLYL